MKRVIKTKYEQIPSDIVPLVQEEHELEKGFRFFNPFQLRV